jgi:hypothetical protein
MLLLRPAHKPQAWQSAAVRAKASQSMVAIWLRSFAPSPR